MGEWRPEQALIEEVAGLLDQQRRAEGDKTGSLRRLQAIAESRQDMPNALAHLLAKESGVAVETRQSAGLFLKNAAGAVLSLPDNLKGHVQHCLLLALGLPEPPLRETAGTGIARMVSKGGASVMHTLAEGLRERAQAGFNSEPAEGAADALAKVCDEAPEAAEQDGSVVSALLSLSRDGRAKTRERALAGISGLAQAERPAALEARIEGVLEAVFALGTDEDEGVRGRVCECIVGAYQVDPQSLMPRMREVVHYMLHATAEAPGEVAQQACEFWSAAAETGQGVEAIGEVLDKLVPTLLRKMRYDPSDEEVAVAEAAEEESSPGSGSENAAVAPAFHSPRKLKPGGDSSEAQFQSPSELEDGDDDDDPFGQEVEWNLRKSSALGLESIAEAFHEEILPHLLAGVQEGLSSPGWQEREAALLALGACSQGCSQGLSSRLSDIVAAASSMSRDARPLVRTISCWTLSRFGGQLAQSSRSGFRELLDRSVSACIERVSHDHNYKVQEAAFAALANLAETAAKELGTWADTMAASLGGIIEKLRRRSLRACLDALSSIAEHASPFHDPQGVAAAVLPPILTAWRGANDANLIISLQKCAGVLVESFGSSFGRYAQETIALAAATCSNCLDSHPEEDWTAVEVICSALDVLTAIAETLPGALHHNAGSAGPHRLAFRSVQRREAAAWQAAFTLLGELARSCAALTSPLENLAACWEMLAPESMSSEAMPALSMALWCAGECIVVVEAERFAASWKPFAERCSAFLSPQLPPPVRDNAAVVMGRILLRCPEEMGPHVSAVAQPVLQRLRTMGDSKEKADATVGLSTALARFPAAASDASMASLFLTCAVSWANANRFEGLVDHLRNAVAALRSNVGPDQWRSHIVSSLSPAVRTKLPTIVGDDLCS